MCTSLPCPKKHTAATILSTGCMAGLFVQSSGTRSFKVPLNILHVDSDCHSQSSE